MNRLQFESSPYLLQHAHNPVDWYAWKPEAFEKARREDKPLLVSIGYSTCHWCHVMERESFEDEAIAELMNIHFVNIKVDREERPDVDQIYMEACQIISASGGWPLNCFLLPDGRPFFAGTYYPPRPAHGRPSWRQLLIHLANAYRTRREEVENQAEELTQAIRRGETLFIKERIAVPDGAPNFFSPEALDRIFEAERAQFDLQNGGFGGAPKFPGAINLQFLLAYHFHRKSPGALEHVHLTLRRMIQGGIYDQLGGGFARYATDPAWLIPHFEKMLYDNALLTQTLAQAYMVDKRPLYRETIEQTLAFIEREMTSPEGGFYAALDADSEGEEGKFYVWDKEEIDVALGEAAPLFQAYHGVSAGGNWEGKNILWRPLDWEDFVAQREENPETLARSLADSQRRLFDIREKRARPGRDEKIILSWNAMQCTAYAAAFQVLGHEAYREAAQRNLAFLDRALRRADGGFYHSYKDGQAQYEAFLDDYALLIEACLAVYAISFKTGYLDMARDLAEYVIALFSDEEDIFFYYTSKNQTDLILRKKEVYDGSTPSGNSSMARHLPRLGILLGKPEYGERARAMLERMAESIQKYPSSFANWALAMSIQVFPPAEIAVLGKQAPALAARLNAHYLPERVIMAAEAPHDGYPLLSAKEAGAQTLIYVCRDYACRRPTREVDEAVKLASE
jgi:uncharacterized protein YyaL (SSP411 family)